MRLIQFVFVALASRKDSVLSYSVFPQQLQSFLRVVKPECNVCLITYCACVSVSDSAVSTPPEQIQTDWKHLNQSDHLGWSGCVSECTL